MADRNVVRCGGVQAKGGMARHSRAVYTLRGFASYDLHQVYAVDPAPSLTLF